MTQRYLYWRSVHNGFAVFAAEVRVAHVEALRAAATWGEIARLEPDTYQIECELREMDDRPLPADEEPFSIDMAAGFDEGDFPPWLQGEMDACLPRELLDRHGTRASSVLNGEYWEIAESSMEGLASDLRAIGHVVTRSAGKDFS